MIASLKSERLKTPNEGSKPEFHLRWIRELVPRNALVAILRTDPPDVWLNETTRAVRVVSETYAAEWISSTWRSVAVKLR